MNFMITSPLEQLIYSICHADVQSGKPDYIARKRWFVSVSVSNNSHISKHMPCNYQFLPNVILSIFLKKIFWGYTPTAVCAQGGWVARMFYRTCVPLSRRAQWTGAGGAFYLVCE